MQTPPVSAAPKLLDQIRHQIRRLHYSIRTEDAYVYWVRFFIRFHDLRHPRDMGAIEAEGWDRGGVPPVDPTPTLALCSASSVPLPLKGRGLVYW